MDFFLFRHQQEEVSRFFDNLPNLKQRALIMTAYAAGMPVSEVVSLRVGGIDSGRMMIRIEQGKGRKDRYVMLSPNLRELLRTCWKIARPAGWLFPGQCRGTHLTSKSSNCRTPKRSLI
jgi:integrase/recombinase XerD